MTAQERHEAQLAATRRDISEATGFDQGEEFSNEQEVRDYFTVQAMSEMFGTDTETVPLSQDELDEMAAAVLLHHWHCRF
jgi:hypothetical protein